MRQLITGTLDLNSEYCTVLFFVVLYCVALYCVVLYSIVLGCSDVEVEVTIHFLCLLLSHTILLRSTLHHAHPLSQCGADKPEEGPARYFCGPQRDGPSGGHSDDND